MGGGATSDIPNRGERTCDASDWPSLTAPFISVSASVLSFRRSLAAACTESLADWPTSPAIDERPAATPSTTWIIALIVPIRFSIAQVTPSVATAAAQLRIVSQQSACAGDAVATSAAASGAPSQGKYLFMALSTSSSRTRGGEKVVLPWRICSARACTLPGSGPIQAHIHPSLAQNRIGAHHRRLTQSAGGDAGAPVH